MTMDYNNYFRNRGTVRSYTERKLSDTELSQMLDAAAHAPNTGNMQWYSAIITRSDEGKKALLEPHFNQLQVENAQAVITFCLDLLRFEMWCRSNNAEPGFENFQSFIAAIIDTSIFAQQFCTIAEMNGLGTCYLGTTTYNAPAIATALCLPERVVPVTTVTVGFPTEAAKPSWRLPVDAIMHFERYDIPTTNQIRQWYTPLEIESAHFVEENSRQTLAQVFTDIRYPRESAEYFSKVYHDFLFKNKFT